MRQLDEEVLSNHDPECASDPVTLTWKRDYKKHTVVKICDGCRNKISIREDEMRQFKNEEVIARWNKGETVMSISLGGLGEGYEDCIQQLLFELFSEWNGRPTAFDGEFSHLYSDFVDETVKKMEPIYGFSGAQVGVAKAAAHQFITYGYSEMMNKAPDHRLIFVSKKRNNEKPIEQNQENGYESR